MDYAYRIDFTFTPPGTLPATGYKLWGRKTGAGDYTIFNTASSAESSISATELESDTEYQFYVTSYNENGAFEDAESEPTAVVVLATEVEVDPPNLVTATLTTATNLELEWNEDVSVGADASVPVVTASGGAVTLTYASGVDTNTWNYTTSRVILNNETLTVAYTKPVDGLQDASGNLMESFTGQAVLNQSDAVVYLQENFEETATGGALGSDSDGYDSPLITAVALGTGGVISPYDTTATVIKGSQQLMVNGGTGDCYIQFNLAGLIDECWLGLQYKGSFATSRHFLEAENDLGVSAFYLGYNGSSRVILGASPAVSVTNVPTAPGRIRVHFVRNGPTTLYVNDANGGNEQSISSTGTDRSIGIIKIGGFNDGGTRYFDNILVQSAPIGPTW